MVTQSGLCIQQFFCIPRFSVNLPGNSTRPCMDNVYVGVAVWQICLAVVCLQFVIAAADIQCGNDDNVVLQFTHVPQQDKLLVNFSASLGGEFEFILVNEHFFESLVWKCKSTRAQLGGYASLHSLQKPWVFKKVQECKSFALEKTRSEGVINSDFFPSDWKDFYDVCCLLIQKLKVDDEKQVSSFIRCLRTDWEIQMSVMTSFWNDTGAQPHHGNTVCNHVIKQCN